jgi:hemerythrin-like domain-containing protein
MDAVTLVRREDQKLEALLERLERRDAHAAEERAALLGDLRAAISDHIDREENILYAIFRERARPVGVNLAPLDQAVAQHRLMDRLARELTQPGPGGDSLDAKLKVLAERIRDHLDIEDTVLLTEIEDVIDDDTLLDLGRRMEQRSRVLVARRRLVTTMVPGDPRSRRFAAVLGGLAAAGTALLALLVRRRRSPPRRKAARWRRPWRR